jgi:hypothetical protein
VRRLAFLLCICLCACAASRQASELPEAEYVRALREEHRALGRVQAMHSWYESTEGEPPSSQPGHDPLVRRTALEALDAALARPGRSANDALALRFLRRALTGEIVAIATAKFDSELARAELEASASVDGRTIGYRDLPNAIAAEPDAGRRARLDGALTAILEEKLNPILERKEKAAQAAARETGFGDYVGLSEELRAVQLPALLEGGVRYVQATDAVFATLLDRLAREELGIPREALHLADLARLWKAPRLAAHFDPALELKALRSFLAGIGLGLTTAAGTEVLIDESLRPAKRPRAFVEPVDAPSDVRLSVKPSGGLGDYWTLFHEAGHAVHFANATATPRELVTLGHGAPGEGFGELFRDAFSDPRWLLRYRAFLVAEGRTAPTNAELAAILRRGALVEMMYLRRYAFAKIAYELRLHGRPERELAKALLLLATRAPVAGAELAPDPSQATDAAPQGPASSAELRELYRQLFSVAYGFPLTEREAARFRSDADDTFASADYARAFVLAGNLQEAMRRRFGPDWYGDPAVGAFLRRDLFAPGESLTAEEVLGRLGFPPRVDVALAAQRALRLVTEADALENAQ